MTKAMASRCQACALYICHASPRTPDSGFMAVMVQRKTPPLGDRKDLITDSYRAVPAMPGRRLPRHRSSVPVVGQPGDDAVTAVAGTYRAFARLEARGRSAAYEALAESVAGDAALAGFIAS